MKFDKRMVNEQMEFWGLKALFQVEGKPDFWVGYKKVRGTIRQEGWIRFIIIHLHPGEIASDYLWIHDPDRESGPNTEFSFCRYCDYKRCEELLSRRTLEKVEKTILTLVPFL